MLHPRAIFYGDCNFNLLYCGLNCNLGLSYKNLGDIKRLLNNSGKFITLTFDDEPSGNRVNDVINILENCKTKATFFPLGERINKKTSEVVEKVYNAGHKLGRHS
ncbi:polysaccharide deacetylase family protein [Wolbachia endosymbiont of Litomosoides brasiliensis]|uniref:polysaccharide deacetylase family protein n=1 Tax=Wolbachia endosymbiont of Litomosoides brasiliensis TaxID=1812117 RepID=UPI001FEC02CD|nr:polysaccharide deacetylase family protein [Wolbachia endosymbiont of Litomosoides brasiliensis]